MAQKVAARMLRPREAVPVPGELCGSRAAPRNPPAAPISCPRLPRVLSLLDERDFYYLVFSACEVIMLSN